MADCVVYAQVTRSVMAVTVVFHSEYLANTISPSAGMHGCCLYPDILCPASASEIHDIPPTSIVIVIELTMRSIPLLAVGDFSSLLRALLSTVRSNNPLGAF
jgi:hypothetical protein